MLDTSPLVHPPGTLHADRSRPWDKLHRVGDKAPALSGHLEDKCVARALKQHMHETPLRIARGKGKMGGRASAMENGVVGGG